MSTTESAARAAFDALTAEGGASTDLNLDVILDVPVSLSLEVGRARIPIRNLLQLNQGSVVELERAAGASTTPSAMLEAACIDQRRRLMRSAGLTTSVRRTPKRSLTTTTSPCAISVPLT